MSEDGDSWIQNALGVDVSQTLQNVSDEASSAIGQVTGGDAASAQAPASAGDGAGAQAGGATGILDTLGSAVSGLGSAVSGGASAVLDGASAVGKAVAAGASAEWDGAKTTYTAVTGAYDAVAPDFNQRNKDLGSSVDWAEDKVKEGDQKLVAQYGDVPVLGEVTKAAAWVNDATAQAAGGVVKGLGDLTTAVENAAFHPIDSAESLAEGALGIAEHVPVGPPGFNTTVKAIHGAVDLISGNEHGEYGNSVGDLAENLLMDTKQDPNDPGKRTNADVDFLASIGGGTKAWEDKPLEAATRTLTNLAPMLLGDEPAEPTPEGRPPTPGGGPPAPDPVDPLGKTQVDPYGKTQPGIPKDGPPTEVDPPKPQPEPDPSPEPETAEQARQNLKSAMDTYEAAKEENFKATQEYVRYRDNMPRPENGWKGDPSKWDPVVDEALQDKATRAGQASADALNKLRDAVKVARRFGFTGDIE